MFSRFTSLFRVCERQTLMVNRMRRNTKKNEPIIAKEVKEHPQGEQTTTANASDATDATKQKTSASTNPSENIKVSNTQELNSTDAAKQKTNASTTSKRQQKSKDSPTKHTQYWQNRKEYSYYYSGSTTYKDGKEVTKEYVVMDTPTTRLIARRPENSDKFTLEKFEKDSVDDANTRKLKEAEVDEFHINPDILFNLMESRFNEMFFNASKGLDFTSSLQELEDFGLRDLERDLLLGHKKSIDTHSNGSKIEAKTKTQNKL